MKRAVVLFMITGTVLMLSGCGFKEGAGATVTVVGSDAPLATRREGINAVVSIPEEFATSEMPFALKCQLRGKPF